MLVECTEKLQFKMVEKASQLQGSNREPLAWLHPQATIGYPRMALWYLA